MGKKGIKIQAGRKEHDVKMAVLWIKFFGNI